MKLIIGLFVVLIVIIIGAKLGQEYLKKNPNPFGPRATATVNKQTLTLLIAKTPLEKETGLSGKSTLAQNQGMLFIFDKPDYYSFWMKNMKFSIDIVFINGNKIVTIWPDVPTPTSSEESLPLYKPNSPADKALEINAGLSKKYNLKEGDEVTFTNLPK